MSSERFSPHTEQVGIIILHYTCIFEFFVDNLSTSRFDILCEKIYDDITSDFFCSICN